MIITWAAHSAAASWIGRRMIVRSHVRTCPGRALTIGASWVVGTGFAYNRLWVIPAVKIDQAAKPARLLTKQDYHLGGAFGGGFLDWSPDDRKIACAHMPRPRFDDWRKLD